MQAELRSRDLIIVKAVCTTAPFYGLMAHSLAVVNNHSRISWLLRVVTYVKSESINRSNSAYQFLIVGQTFSRRIARGFPLAWELDGRRLINLTSQGGQMGEWNAANVGLRRDVLKFIWKAEFETRVRSYLRKNRRRYSYRFTVHKSILWLIYTFICPTIHQYAEH